MKRLFYVLAAMAAIFMTGCGGKSPESVLNECWKNIDKGRYGKAVRCFDIADSEVDVYKEMFAEKGASVKSCGGVDKVEILSTSTGVDDAEVEAEVSFGNGRSVKRTYYFIRKSGDWKICNR